MGRWGKVGGGRGVRGRVRWILREVGRWEGMWSGRGGGEKRRIGGVCEMGGGVCVVGCLRWGGYVE